MYKGIDDMHVDTAGADDPINLYKPSQIRNAENPALDRPSPGEGFSITFDESELSVAPFAFPLILPSRSMCPLVLELDEELKKVSPIDTLDLCSFIRAWADVNAENVLPTGGMWHGHVVLS